MDSCLKKQVESVVKGIVLFDIVVMAVMFAVSTLSPDKQSNSLVLETLKFDISSVTGIVLGSAVSIFNFYMLASETEKMVNNRTGSGRAKFAGGYFLRFFLYAIVLLIGAKVDYVSMFTAAIGLLSTQIVLMVQKIAFIFRRKGE